MTFTPATDKSLEAVMGNLAKKIEAKAEELKLEQSEIQRLQELLRKQERKIEQLREELERERMATKVIERLGGNGLQATGEALAGMDFEALSSLEAGTAKRSRRRKSKDSGDIATPASEVSLSTWVEPGKIQL
jgi:predicted RNase H-like nuclease (RuvC/YqgF family)